MRTYSTEFNQPEWPGLDHNRLLRLPDILQALDLPLLVAKIKGRIVSAEMTKLKSAVVITKDRIVDLSVRVMRVC